MQSPSESPCIDSLMRRHFITVAPEDSADDVLRLMNFARLRCLPVVRGGILVGLVGYRTLVLSRLHLDPDGAGHDPQAALVADLMEQPPGTVPTRAPTSAAARELWESGRGCVAVVEAAAAGPRIVGLVTENDLLRAAYRPRSLPC